MVAWYNNCQMVNLLTATGNRRNALDATSKSAGSNWLPLPNTAILLPSNSRTFPSLSPQLRFWQAVITNKTQLPGSTLQSTIQPVQQPEGVSERGFSRYFERRFRDLFLHVFFTPIPLSTLHCSVAGSNGGVAKKAKKRNWDVHDRVYCWFHVDCFNFSCEFTTYLHFFTLLDIV